MLGIKTCHCTGARKYRILSHRKASTLNCFFVTDLHGQVARYEKLFQEILRQRPDVVLIGGDILPATFYSELSELPGYNFVRDYLSAGLQMVRQQLAENYPNILVILGNDDPRSEEQNIVVQSEGRLFRYLHGQATSIGKFEFYGYGCVPPTPFALKDWELYDVSRYVPPGCVSPEEGYRSVDVPDYKIKWGTIKDELDLLAGKACLDRAIFLMHSPPYDTSLDYAALAGMKYEHVPLDPHVGSIAVRRFIENHQPLMTLHGHIHEAARLSGEWKIQIGRTVCINAAHDGPELAVVQFNPEAPDAATKELV